MTKITIDDLIAFVNNKLFPQLKNLTIGLDDRLGKMSRQKLTLNMTTENTLSKQNSFHNELKIVKELVYDKCGFDLKNTKLNIEGVAYGACSFELNGVMIQHRVSKITPTKTGQFVAIWKRNIDGLTRPFEVSDHLDFIVITARSDHHFGQFVFPKSVLADQGIISQNGKPGKRGIRVYPPWDITKNKQAERTQSWQTKYFLTIKNDHTTDLDLTKRLYIKTTGIE